MGMVLIRHEFIFLSPRSKSENKQTKDGTAAPQSSVSQAPSVLLLYSSLTSTKWSEMAAKSQLLHLYSNQKQTRADKSLWHFLSGFIS